MNPSLRAIHGELGIPSDYADTRKLAPQVEAPESELVDVGLNPDGRTVRLARDAAAAWQQMQAAATRAEVPLVPISGFRSVARQIELIHEKLAAGTALDDILRYVAAPGFSEHHTGCAIDIGSPEHIELDEDFERTLAFKWLSKHAGDFGFTLSYPRSNPHGIGYEPWHWFWRK